MKKNIPVILFIFLAVGLLARLASHRSSADSLQEIGVLMPLTGDASSYGQKGRKAIEMAVDDFNAKEGSSGKKIAAAFEDSKG
ncbi:MAG: ABC transporter substrate-binding protein, partial [Anaerolineales bacterium]